MTTLSRLGREPLVAFLAIGALLFAIYHVAGRDTGAEIVVSQIAIDRLVSDRELILERPLTAEERALLTQDFIDQDVLIREAMARKLYLNDGQVRHRLADKMYYLLTDEPAIATDAEIETYYAENRDKYRTPERVTFEHRFFAGDRAAAESALAALELDGTAPTGAVPFWMGDKLQEYAANELIAIFGTPFTIKLASLSVDAWMGPIESSRGWHVVRLLEKIPQRDMPRTEIEELLRRDWRDDQLRQSRRQQLDELRRNYRIVLPEPSIHD